MSLDELEARTKNTRGEAVILDPQTILSLIACVRAADAVRRNTTFVDSAMTVEEREYDAARARLAP